MNTLKTIHDLLDATASNYLCAVEGTTERVFNAYMPNGYADINEAENDIICGLGEAYDNIVEIESGKIEDVNGLLERICKGHIMILEAYRDAIRLANKK